MSVASQIQRIKDAVADAYDSVEEKGGTLPATENVANLATAIDSIQTGSQPVISPLIVTANGTYTSPSGTDGYSPVTVNVQEETYSGENTLYYCRFTEDTGLTIVMEETSSTSVIDWGDGSSEICGSWSQKSHTYSDYGEYVITVRPNSAGAKSDAHPYQVTFAPYKIKIGTTWSNAQVSTMRCQNPDLELIVNEVVPTVNNSIRFVPPVSSDFKSNKIPRIVYNTNTNGSSVNTVDCFYQGMFSCKYLVNKYTGSRWDGTQAREIIFDGPTVTAYDYPFCFCTKLVKITGIDHLIVQNARYMFSSCSRLRSIDFDIDIQGSTGDVIDGCFAGCTSLVKLPVIRTDLSVTFAPCTGIKNKNSVATFVDGEITGGFVYALNTCANEGQTITFNSTIKNLFDATEQAAIEAMLTAKNWTCAW